jgi:hypothetical protein
MSVSGAIRWCILPREAGPVAPGPLGGDRRSEAHGVLLRSLVEQKPDTTLEEIPAKLAKMGLSAGTATDPRP